MNDPIRMMSLDLQLRREIDRRCLVFEDAWRDGGEPSLERELAGFASEGQSALFRELLRIEFEMRQNRDQLPNASEYERRFPAWSTIVREVFAQEYPLDSSDSSLGTRRAGRYTILRDHARGGLGKVYLARDEELMRDVALKEMQAQHVTDQDNQARFLQEAKITGGLEHPGIVPVYSLGANPDGNPFYAMRFIQGESLKDAIDRLHGIATALDPAGNEGEPAASEPAPSADPPAVAAAVSGDLSSDKATADSTSRGHVRPPARSVRGAVTPRRYLEHGDFTSFEFRQLLSRFAYICRVIDYAHSRGVLHRDLKPSNIMLGKYGETLVVDWGLARRLDQPESGSHSGTSTIVREQGLDPTSHGLALGTPSYMSPEQAEGHHDRLSPASDVYSLGATLYHLLTGRPPVVGRNSSERLRRAQESIYPRARILQPAIPAALEAICMRAIASKPEDRYPSPGKLADDLEHWMADEPTSTYREPFLARLARWSRRHQTWAISGVVAIVLVAISLAAISVLVMKSNHQLGLSRSEANTKRKEAEQERDQSKAMSDFLVESFRSPEPDRDGYTVTVAEILERSTKDLLANEELAPLTKAKLLMALGNSAYGLGIYKQAVTNHEAALGLLIRVLGTDHETSLLCVGELAAFRSLAGDQTHLIPTLEQLLEKQRTHLGQDHSTTLATQHNLATAYMDGNRIKDGVALYEETRQALMSKLGSNHPDTLACSNSLGNAYAQTGLHMKGIQLLTTTRDARRSIYGPTHPLSLKSDLTLAKAFELAGKYDDTIAILETSLPIMRDKLGVSFPLTLNSETYLASAYKNAGRYKEGIELAEKSLTSKRSTFGPDHISTLTTEGILASLYVSTARYTEAIRLLDPRLSTMIATFGDDAPVTAAAQADLAFAFKHIGRLAEAARLYSRSIESSRKSLGINHPKVLLNQNNLGAVLHALGKYEESIEIFRSTLAEQARTCGPEHPDTLQTQGNLAVTLLSIGRIDEAIPLFEQAYSAQCNKLGREHPASMRTLSNLANVCVRARQFDKAIDLFDQVISHQSKQLGIDHPATLASRQNNATAYFSAGKVDKAIEMLQDTIDIATRKYGASHLDVIDYKANLAFMKCETGCYDKGIQIYEEIAPLLDASLGATHIRTVANTSATVRAYAAAQDYDKAITLCMLACQQHKNDEHNVLFHVLLGEVFYANERLCDAEMQCRMALEVSSNRSQKDHNTHCACLVLLGMALLDQGKFADAEWPLRECVKIREKVSSNDWSMPNVLSLLGASLSGQGRYEEAEPLLVKGQAGLFERQDAIPARIRHQRLTSSLERLLKLYNDWNKPEEAGRWNLLLKSESWRNANQ